MVSLLCTLCGHKWEAPIGALWCCDVCEIGCSQIVPLEADLSEFGQYLDILHQNSSKKLSDPTTVWLAETGIEWGSLDSDILALLFDKIVLLCDDSIVLPRRQEYIEAGIFSTIEIDPPLTELLGKRRPKYLPEPNFRISELINFMPVFEGKPNIPLIDPVEGQPIGPFLDQMASMITLGDVKRNGVDVILRNFTESVSPPISGNYTLDPIGSMLHLLNKLNGNAIIASLLGIRTICDEALSAVWWAKLCEREDSIRSPHSIHQGLNRWYSSKCVGIRQRIPIEQILTFRRDDEARNRLIEFLKKNRSVPSDSLDDYAQEISNKVDKAIEAYRRLHGRAQTFKESLLGGLIAGLGGLIGGPEGVLLGSIASATTVYFARELDHNRLEPWTCYFSKWIYPQDR
jgi:hypothetical protein